MKKAYKTGDYTMQQIADAFGCIIPLSAKRSIKLCSKIYDCKTWLCGPVVMIACDVGLRKLSVTYVSPGYAYLLSIMVDANQILIIDGRRMQSLAKQGT